MLLNASHYLAQVSPVVKPTVVEDIARHQVIQMVAKKFISGQRYPNIGKMFSKINKQINILLARTANPIKTSRSSD